MTDEELKALRLALDEAHEDSHGIYEVELVTGTKATGHIAHVGPGHIQVTPPQGGPPHTMVIRHIAGFLKVGRDQ